MKDLFPPFPSLNLFLDVLLIFVILIGVSSITCVLIGISIIFRDDEYFIIPLSNILVVNISHSTRFLFAHLFISLYGQNIFNFVKFHLPIVDLSPWANVVYSQRHFLHL